MINVSDMVLAGYPEPARLERRIRHVRATDEGHIHLDLVDWPHFSYTGRSVLKLRDELWLRQGIFNVYLKSFLYIYIMTKNSDPTLTSTRTTVSG